MPVKTKENTLVMTKIFFFSPAFAHSPRFALQELKRRGVPQKRVHNAIGYSHSSWVQCSSVQLSVHCDAAPLTVAVVAVALAVVSPHAHYRRHKQRQE
jgi:hypothetical protein